MPDNDPSTWNQNVNESSNLKVENKNLFNKTQLINKLGKNYNYPQFKTVEHTISDEHIQGKMYHIIEAQVNSEQNKNQTNIQE